MAGTKEGGIKTYNTNITKYGSDWYSRIGAIGGSRSTTGGFYARRDIARAAGRIGGTISRRGQGRPQRMTASYHRKLEQAYKHLLKVQQAAAKERVKQKALATAKV